MKAARLHGTQRQLIMESIDVPSPRDGEVLIRVKASGICHSDINYRDGVSPVGRLPITLGHEIAGVVADIGNDVRGLEKDDRVSVHYVISCGQCKYCTAGFETYCAHYQMIGKDVDGGFAEYLSIPASNALPLPDHVALEQGAILGCAVSTAYHALRRARVEPTDTVMVCGIGGLGVHAVQLASAVFRARSVIAVDVLDEKLSLARRLGAKGAFNASAEDPAEKIRQMTDGTGAEVVLDFVGRRSTIQKSIGCAAKGGRIVVAGISSEELQISPYSTIIGKEIELLGVNDHFKSEQIELIDLVSRGKIDISTSITHRLKLEEVNRGIEILEKNIGTPIRIVLEQ